MNERHPCIVSYIDLVDVKLLLEDNKPEAVSKMMEFQKVVEEQINSAMPLHERAYSWNDSVLLLAFLDGTPHSYQSIIKEVNHLKKCITPIAKCYAISVQGLTLPQAVGSLNGKASGPPEDHCKHIYVRASSMALTNCFEIEKKLKGKNKAWYVDSRIAEKIETRSLPAQAEVSMLPTGEARQVYMYDEDLW